MKSLLNALQEGRLIELPDADKNRSMELLAVLIEAVPDIGTDEDLVAAVNQRESQGNTALGFGVACPHVRTHKEGELLCALGWSPQGIDYGSPDGQPVHLVVLYYIPDSQRNAYLKELSAFAKAIKANEGIHQGDVKNLQDLRNNLLDWISQAMEAAHPDAKAKMIKLEAKQAELEHQSPLSVVLPAALVSFSVASAMGSAIVLTQDNAFFGLFQGKPDLAQKVAEGDDFEIGGYRVVILQRSGYLQGTFLASGIAWKVS